MRERLLSVEQLSGIAPPDPLVEGLLYRNTLAQLSATAGSYKTFAAIAMSCAVALGEDWEGHRVPRAEKVIYVAAEGASGLRARILGWCELSGYDPARLADQLYVLPCPIQLASLVDVSEACDMAREIGAGLVVLDTRAKCTLGLEENSATEQGRAIAAAERIQDAAGCTVFDIHHAGRNGSTPRGSTAWDGGVWSDLRMEGSDLVAKITCEKHKDAPSGCEHHFRAVPHTVSKSLMPDVPETSRKTLVFVSNDRETFGESLTAVVRQVWNALETSPTAAGMSGASIIEISGASKASVYRTLKSLQHKGFVRNTGTDKRPMFVGTALGRQAFGSEKVS
ncbi:AAA family ATPase [Gordonia hongkongensis]|uniref:AAA family ATPase n=1 Tax=Gordonia hongkongensis TaxID=1701090 RepID=UPI003D70B670